MTNHFQHLTPRHARSAQRAFTLVELMVVIAIIGILAVVTLVSSRRMSAGARVSSATNAVTAVLASASQSRGMARAVTQAFSAS